MNWMRHTDRVAGGRTALGAGLAGLLLVAGLAACENHGEPFVPIRPHGPDSTLVDGLEQGRWVAKKSPYFVMSPIRILAGRTLTIDPGVTVIFTRKDYGFLVEGQLLAVGKQDSLITFRPTFRPSTTPQPGEWNEILFQNSVGSRVEFASVRYSKRGLRALNSTVFLRSVNVGSTEIDAVQATRSNLTMLDCTLAVSGRHGLFLDGCENPPYQVRLEHLNIGFNQGAGIWSQNSSFLLLRSDIKNNGQDGSPAVLAASSGIHLEGLSGLVAPVVHRCNLDLNRPCDLRNDMGSQIVVQADSNYWGPNTTDELQVRSGGLKDQCFFNLNMVCDGLDSLTADIPTVSVCYWSDTFFPNFSTSGQAPDWGRVTPRSR